MNLASDNLFTTKLPETRNESLFLVVLRHSLVVFRKSLREDFCLLLTREFLMYIGTNNRKRR